MNDDYKDQQILIVICTRNRFIQCKILVRELFKQIIMFSHGNNFRILIIDNGSKPKISNLYYSLSSLSPKIICLNMKYTGLSYARNIALSLASSKDFLYFLDDDIHIGAHFIKNLWGILLKENPDFLGGPVDSKLPNHLPFWVNTNWFSRNFADSGYGAKRLSGGNFGLSMSSLNFQYRFDESLGMKGNRVRLGEEKDFLEVYLASSSKPKIFYSNKLSVLEEFDLNKLKFSYRIRREFAIGYADHADHTQKVTKKFYRPLFRMKPSEVSKAFSFAKNNFESVYETLSGKNKRKSPHIFILTVARLSGLFLRKLRWQV